MEKANKLPGLILIAGLPASGKTWFARALAAKIAAIHLNSDALRAELGLRGQYDLRTKQVVYDAMKERGITALKAGHTVIVDSTFYKQELRKPWLQMADKLNVPSYFIKIEIPEGIAFERLKERREDSEADKAVYLKIKTQWEPVDIEHLTLDSSSMSAGEMVENAMAYILK